MKNTFCAYIGTSVSNGHPCSIRGCRSCGAQHRQVFRQLSEHNTQRRRFKQREEEFHFPVLEASGERSSSRSRQSQRKKREARALALPATINSSVCIRSPGKGKHGGDQGGVDLLQSTTRSAQGDLGGGSTVRR